MLCAGFPSWQRLSWGVGSRRTGFSACGRWVSSCGAQALAAPRHVGSSQTRDQTCVPCTGRRFLTHCAPREALNPLTVTYIHLGKASRALPDLPLLVFSHISQQYPHNDRPLPPHQYQPSHSPPRQIIQVFPSQPSAQPPHLPGYLLRLSFNVSP